MKKYFYSNGIEKDGPFTLNELLNKKISKETLIWYEGLEDWVPAYEVGEIAYILETSPPDLPSEHNNLFQTSELSKDKIIESNCEEEIIDHQDQDDIQTVNIVKQGMFSSPFSFEGRIRRMEFGISFITVMVVNTFLNVIVASGEAPIIALAYIPTVWFLWAQGAKRCHDRGNSGWYQIIPFYVLWLIFAEGETEYNEYGPNPKQ